MSERRKFGIYDPIKVETIIHHYLFLYVMIFTHTRCVITDKPMIPLGLEMYWLGARVIPIMGCIFVTF